MGKIINTSGQVTSTVVLPAPGLPLAGGTMTGDVTFSADVRLVLVASELADGKSSGIIEYGTTGETTSYGSLMYFKAADSSWWKVNSADKTTCGATCKLGIALYAGAAGAAKPILLWGKVRADAIFPTLTIGAPAYMAITTGASNGLIQVAAPSATGNVSRIVGYGNTADELFFCPSNEWSVHV